MEIVIVRWEDITMHGSETPAEDAKSLGTVEFTTVGFLLEGGDEKYLRMCMGLSEGHAVDTLVIPRSVILEVQHHSLLRGTKPLDTAP